MKDNAEYIKVADIVVEGNIRRHFDEQKMKELTESVQEHGVVEPILVRRRGDDFVLIAGERRLRASKGAKVDTIMAVIKDVDEKGAAELQLIENLHREDLTPLDEAHALKVLWEAGPHTFETLAERIDKSAAYVGRSIRLLGLPKEALEAIQDGVITPAHGHQILRAPADKHAEIVEHVLETIKHRPMTAGELRNVVEHRYGMDLSTAIFPKGKAYAGEIACTGCPYNSGNQGQLFDGAEKGKCSNAECFKKKTGAFMEDYSKKAAEEHPGLQYLGIQSVDYSGGVEGMKRSMVVTAPTKKMLQANPEKFGWCVVSPRNPGDKPTTAVVCLDRRILAPAKEPAVDRSESGVQAPRTGSAKEAFINEKVTAAFREAIAATVEPRLRFDFTEAQWAIILDQANNQDGTPLIVTGMTDRALAQALLAHAVMQGPDWTAAMKALKINRDQLEKVARKQADAEWAAKGDEK